MNLQTHAEERCTKSPTIKTIDIFLNILYMRPGHQPQHGQTIKTSELSLCCAWIKTASQ